jgi:hypothetical protein
MKILEELRLRLGGIQVDAMNGDNLAVTLCTHFDDGEESEDDSSWSKAALDGQSTTLDAIHAHYATVITQLVNERDGEREARERCSAALRTKDDAVGVLIARLQKAGDDCSDLIP